MATKKTSKPAAENVEKDILDMLQPLADGLKVAVGELWGIFVRQSVVRGISELFAALVFGVAAYMLQDAIQFWALIPALISVVLIYDAIQWLGNPKYYALKDINQKMSEFKNVG